MPSPCQHSTSPAVRPAVKRFFTASQHSPVDFRERMARSPGGKGCRRPIQSDPKHLFSLLSTTSSSTVASRIGLEVWLHTGHGAGATTPLPRPCPPWCWCRPGSGALRGRQMVAPVCYSCKSTPHASRAPWLSCIPASPPLSSHPRCVLRGPAAVRRLLTSPAHPGTRGLAAPDVCAQCISEAWRERPERD